MAEHHLKARLAFRVGVTGHRPKALQNADERLLRSSIRSVLEKIQGYVAEVLQLNSHIYAPGAPLLRVISPLAEGSDRLVAKEALDLGYELQSPLPFPREEYENDFKTPESKAQFKALLDEATATFELDGSRQECDQAYKAVGHLVLRQSDLLIAIWDGESAKGIGGTGQIVQDAMEAQIPVVWIGITPPHHPALLLEVTEAGKAAQIGDLAPPKIEAVQPDQQPPSLESRIKEILVLPPGKEPLAFQYFLGERWPHRRYSIGYRLFCKTFVWNWRLPKFRVPTPEEDPASDWLKPWSNLQGSNAFVGPWIVQQFRPAFYRADRIADVLADRFRSFFVGTYLFGACAVLAAFLGAYPREPGGKGIHAFFWIEFALISGILLLVYLNAKNHWHRRWIEYRLLAEGLRQMAALAPFARVTPSFEVPVHLGEDTGPTWYNWYFRALIRQAGMVTARVDTDNYLNHCKGALLQEVNVQVEYHESKHKEHGDLHERVHALSILLFSVTLIACVLHLMPIRWLEPVLGQKADFLLTFYALVLPAFGYAIQGILYQGEFGRVGRRSKGINSRLRELQKQLSEGTLSNFGELGRSAERFSRIQLQEQTDWRAVFIMKEVGL